MIDEKEILENSRKDISTVMKKLLVIKDEQIAELKAEVLELRTENEANLNPIDYAKEVIELYKESEREHYLDDLSELADYIMTYVDHHQFDMEEGDEDVD